MANGLYRIGIVGATSLAGKELADELQESLLGASEIVLLDENEEAAGQMTAAGDEPIFIQRIEPASFDRMDFVFFTGDAAETQKFWQQARRSGASLIDLSYGLETEKDVLVRGPMLSQAGSAALAPDLKTPAVTSAHPAALMLALVAQRLQARMAVTYLTATVMEPASEHGRAAMDELHQQTVNLLSFHAVPKEQYDAQVSFNLMSALGSDAKIDLGVIRRRIQMHYNLLSAGTLPLLALQLVQAPVFHGYSASVLVQLKEKSTVEELEASFAGDLIEIVAHDGEPPSNVATAGLSKVMTQVTAVEGDASATRFWLWLAADNLKLGALNAIACALELRRLRPSGKVQ